MEETELEPVITHPNFEMQMPDLDGIWPGVEKLNKDLKEAAENLDPRAIRFTVDTFYQIQGIRKATNNRAFAAEDTEEPHALWQWFFKNFKGMENEAKKALTSYTYAHPLWQNWCANVEGMGPVLFSNIVARLDITRPGISAGNWNSFAGLNPDMVWEAGKLRPFNRKLKTALWLTGECFAKIKGFYHDVIVERKAYEVKKNENGDYADQAEKRLNGPNKVGKTTVAYKSYIVGKLPKGHIHQRCKRYAVKLFLSHLFEVWHTIHFGVRPGKPYIIAVGGHKDYIPPPHFDFEPFIKPGVIQ
jgi:hypothetical protein